MLHKTNDFLDNLFCLLDKHELKIGDWFIDHLCYRTGSIESYEVTKRYFENYGTLLIESEVNGRNIATYKLKEQIAYRDYLIPLVEVPAPKKDKYTIEGWEHIEVVIDIPFNNLIKMYPSLNFNKKSLSKIVTPELVLYLDDYSIKFHHQSLEEIIKKENEVSS